MTDIGNILGGRYRLIELLGEGGMATIYRARDNQLERDVAVKVLRPEYGRDPDFVARFRLEAQAAASLNHPGIVAVHDFGTDPAGPFIVMELVDGEDLATIIRRSGALSPRQAARMTAQVARALAVAHAGGLVHRDVKPGNVMVDRTGRARVTDFGISRAVAEAALTLPGITLGSVHYFSPEQARGELATEASDIYSLGIVLYELLTGRRPWEGDSAAAIATARLTGAVPSVSTVRAAVPPILEAIDRKALAPDPADRFRSATEFAEALERFVADEGAATGGKPAAGVGAASPASPASPVSAVTGDDAARTVASATARPNAAARVPYVPDAYVDAGADPDGDGPPRAAGGTGTGRTRSARQIPDDPDDAPTRGSGPWLWISAVLALVILGLAGFLIFRLLSGPTTPPTEQVTVPELVGMSYEEAQQAADDLGLVVIRFKFEASGEPDGTVLSQDPEPGEQVDPGAAIRLTLALGDETVSVPDLRGRTESEAVNLISAAGLKIGIRTEAFDPFIPAGAVVSQDPGPGLVVTKGLEVNYVISKGLEPTPTPSPTPTPTPTPAPTPTPTPEPTPTPTPAPIEVGNYVGMTVGEARAAVIAAGFTFVVLPGDAPDDRIVTDQDPPAGSFAAPGTKVTVSAPLPIP